VIDKINDRIEVDQFSLGMEVLNVGNTAPATEPLCARLQAWLASLDADQLITRGSLDTDDGIEFLEWGQGSWRLVFKAYPLVPDRRGSGGRIIGTLRPAEAQRIDDVTPVRKRLSEKAKAYGDLTAPFVIAIDAVSDTTDDRDFTAALYGTPEIRYYENPGPGAPPPHQRPPTRRLVGQASRLAPHPGLRSSRKHEDHAVDCRIGGPDAVASPRRRPAGQQHLPLAAASTTRPHP
jgi:hypothetical protein